MINDVRENTDGGKGKGKRNTFLHSQKHQPLGLLRETVGKSEETPVQPRNHFEGASKGGRGRGHGQRHHLAH